MLVRRPVAPTIPVFFFFNDTATTEIYTLSLHDALPICQHDERHLGDGAVPHEPEEHGRRDDRSEEHTSELQSQSNLVCRLLLEKKKTYSTSRAPSIRITIPPPTAFSYSI